MSKPYPDRAARDRIIEFAMIDDPSAWPRSDSGKCCIFEALNVAGQALFGPDWHGSELRAVHWQEQPKEKEARRVKYVESGRAFPNAPVPPGSFRQPRDSVKDAAGKDFREHVISRRAYLGGVESAKRAEAIEREQERWEANHSALDRLTHAAEWLAQKCRDGFLTGYVRTASGGQLEKMEACEWNVEAPVSRFVAKGGYERRPVDGSSPYKAMFYIFFDKSELAKEVSTFSHVPATFRERDLSPLSPFLQFAVRLALKKGYTSSESIDSKAVREAEVRAAWDEFMPDVPKSEASVSMIAGIIGFPNARAIERGSQGGVNRKKLG